jgi:hypothetical protein
VTKKLVQQKLPPKQDLGKSSKYFFLKIKEIIKIFSSILNEK